MSDCVLTMEDLEKSFLDWVKIDSDVVNVSKVLNDLLDLIHPKDVTWIARDSDGNIITVTVPNIAKIVENIKVDAVSRSELTSILTNYYTKLEIDEEIKEGLINFIKQNYYDKTYIDQLYTTVRQVIDGLSEDTKDASRLSKGTLDPDRLPEVIHSDTTGDADTVDGLHGDQLVRADEDDYLYGSYTIAHDLTVLGNLNVQGEQTSQNTNELNVSDTWITLNEGESSDHVTNITSGIKIDRGSSNPARIYWDDDKDKWMVDYGENIGYELFSKGYMGSGSGLDADKLDGLDSSQFVRSDIDDVINGIITFIQHLKTDKINNATGTQIVINAGESDGKVANQIKEAVYVNAEQGLIVSTPDRDHSNWDSGYIVKVTEILGDSIKTENINLNNQLRISDDNQNVTINKDRINISQKDNDGNVYRYETLINANDKSIISNWYENGNLITSKALVLNSDGTVSVNNHLTIENSGITIKRTNTPSQYLTITENEDISTSPAIVSYSATDNAKAIFYDSKTNNNNDEPTAGMLGHIFRVNESPVLELYKSESVSKTPIRVNTSDDNQILMNENTITLYSNNTDNVNRTISNIDLANGGEYLQFTIKDKDENILNDFKLSRTSGLITINGNKIWHEGNDGANSGLDADKLDGLDSSQFVRSDIDDVINGIITFNKSIQSNINTGGDILKWNNSGLLRKITDQGGLLIKADSSLVLSAGDQTDVSLLGINSDTDSEVIHFIADGHIEFRTNTQDGIGNNDKLFVFNNNGSVELNNSNVYINKNNTYQIHTLNMGGPYDGKRINKFVGYNVDTKPSLLLFAKVYNGSDKLPKQGFEGRIYLNRGGTNAYNISEFIDITCVGAYDSNINYISGHNSLAKIVKTTYNNEDWYGLYIYGRSTYAIFLDGIIWGDYIFINDASDYSITDYIYPTFNTAGYHRLDNGLILQWGYASATIDEDEDIKINFPITFPHAAVHATGVIIAAESYSGVFNLYLNSLTTNYVIFHSDNSTTASADVKIRYFAIGY